jgi:dynein heavy chain
LVQLKESCANFNLQSTDVFIGKIMQLYDTIQVRHGLMIVGPTGGGKTRNYETLQHAMTSIAKDPKNTNKAFTKVHTHILNPKAIKMG